MWNAKPSGAYVFSDEEAKQNMSEIYYQLKDTWTIEAISGMIGNMWAESGLNPWRWQSDIVDLDSPYAGYGLVQFTPAYGYIYDYGVSANGYAPNLSTTGVLGGKPSDGKAQIIVIDEDRAGKFLDRSYYCTYLDISSAYPFSAYKQITDLYLASTAWLFNYEFPADYSKDVADYRYSLTQMVYEYLTGEPEPPTPTKRKEMPIWMWLRKF